MKSPRWQYQFAGALLALSVALYLIRWLAFPGEAY